jgi:putative tricarboxylic transport membrane protein
MPSDVARSLAPPDGDEVKGTPRASAVRYLGSLTTLAIGAVAVVLSTRLGVGSLRQPEPGLWPVIVSGGVCLFALTSLLDDRQDHDPESLPMRRMVAGVAALALFVLAFQHLGLLVPTFLTITVWLRSLAGESWRLSLGIGAGATAALWLVFARLLGVPFPPGVLGV